MSKILVIGKYYSPFSGGIEEHTRSICEHAAKQHEVDVLVSNHEKGSRIDELNGVRIIRKHVHINIKNQPISLGFFSGVNFSDYDLVQFHSPNPAVSAQFIKANLFRKWPKLVITHHMDIYGRKLLRLISMPFMRTMFDKAAFTIVTSMKNAKISKDLPEKGRYVAIPLAIDPADYPVTDAVRAEAMAWRKEIAGDAPVVGFIGRHARYKGLDVFMRALVKLPGVHAFIGGDGPERARAEALVKELKISDRVHFFGLLPHRDKIKLLVSLDAFIFPSTEITEAFGISQLEAMLCGAPVIASELPTGVTDVSINEVTALTFPPGHVNALTDRMSQLLADPEKAASLATKAREHVLTNMSHDVVNNRTIKLFEDVIAAR